MRRLSITAFLAVPLLLVGLLFTTNNRASANPHGYENYGCAGFCFKLFPHMHQHGPLFNYGPYYGYYPFKPYGPWDAYLRYDPFFYGDPYENWRAKNTGNGAGNMYGWNQNFPQPGGGGGFGGHAHGGKHGFWHASWLHGGWFKGHEWFTHSQKGLFHKSCSSCGGVAQTAPLAPPRDVTTRYVGVGIPEQSAVFYSATPTLDPRLDLLPASAQTK